MTIVESTLNKRVAALARAAMREAVIVLWEASDRVCGKRLRPLLPVLVEAMERHGHLRLAHIHLNLLGFADPLALLGDEPEEQDESEGGDD